MIVQNNKKKIDKYKKIEGTVGKTKIFDQLLCDTYDINARQNIKKLLGDSVSDNPDIYGVDMITFNNTIPYKYIELQVYGKWTDTFPRESPYIYARKMKYCDQTLFICFNATYDKIILFSRCAINPTKHRTEKYSREYVYYVPWESTYMIRADLLSVDVIQQYFDFLQ